MKPYKFHHLWIDLDTVQAISELRQENRMGFGGYFLEMHIQFAFQNKPYLFSWNQRTVWVGAEPNRQLIPELVEGEWSKLVEIRPEYNALLKAWKNEQDH